MEIKIIFSINKHTAKAKVSERLQIYNIYQLDVSNFSVLCNAMQVYNFLGKIFFLFITDLSLNMLRVICLAEENGK